MFLKVSQNFLKTFLKYFKNLKHFNRNRNFKKIKTPVLGETLSFQGFPGVSSSTSKLAGLNAVVQDIVPAQLSVCITQSLFESNITIKLFVVKSIAFNKQPSKKQPSQSAVNLIIYQYCPLRRYIFKITLSK